MVMRRRNRHHMTPKCRQGSNEPWNILLLDVQRHELYHKIFGVRTLDETIQLLCRLRRMKNRRKEKQ
jgi:hypothetical protein